MLQEGHSMTCPPVVFLASQQLGGGLRRPLCSDRRNPASDLLEVSRGLLYKHRPWDIKGRGVAHALGAGRPCVSSGLGPADLHTKTLLGFRLVGGIKGTEVPPGELRHFHCKTKAGTLETSDRH